MNRRLTTLAAAPVIAGLAVALAAPANAAPSGTTPEQRSSHRSVMKVAAKMQPNAAARPYGTCKLVVPSRVRVGALITDIPVQVTGGCVLHLGLKAIWYRGSNDLMTSEDAVVFEGASTSSWYVFSMGPLGTRTWRGWAALDSNQNVYSQNEPETTVKLVSYAGLNTTRARGKTTLNTRVIRYATSLDENIPYAGETGLIQYREKGQTSWKGLKNVVANSRGLYSYSYTTSKVREYRVVYKETTYIWGSTSPVRTS